MKIAILYSSLCAGPGTTCVMVAGSPVFIRGDLCATHSLDRALDLAKPREHETVLNTIPLELPPPSALEKAKAVLENVLAST